MNATQSALVREPVLQLDANGQQKANRLKNIQGVKAKDMIQVDPRLIRIRSRFNPRDFTLPHVRAELDKLKASILQHGLRSPVWVTYEPDPIEIGLLAGERRLRAVLELIDEGHPFETIMALQVECKDELAALTAATIENSDRAELTEWEEGKLFARFMDVYGQSIESVAIIANKTVTQVRNAVELSKAPDAVIQLVAEDSISPAVARQAVKKHGRRATEVLEADVAQAKAAGTGKVTRKADPSVVPARDKVRILTEAMRYVVDNIDTVSARTIKTRAKTALVQIGAEKEK